MAKDSARRAGAQALEAELAAILKLSPEERAKRLGKSVRPKTGPELDWDAVRWYFQNEVGGKWARKEEGK